MHRIGFQRHFMQHLSSLICLHCLISLAQLLFCHADISNVVVEGLTESKEVAHNPSPSTKGRRHWSGQRPAGQQLGPRSAAKAPKVALPPLPALAACKHLCRATQTVLHRCRGAQQMPAYGQPYTCACATKLAASDVHDCKACGGALHAVQVAGLSCSLCCTCGMTACKHCHHCRHATRLLIIYGLLASTNLGMHSAD